MNENELIFADGTSINYFRDDGTFDLFIIINSPNEYDDIEGAISYLDTIDIETVDIKELHDYLEKNYFGFGCEVLKKNKNNTYTKC